MNFFWLFILISTDVLAGFEYCQNANNAQIVNVKNITERSKLVIESKGLHYSKIIDNKIKCRLTIKDASDGIEYHSQYKIYSSFCDMKIGDKFKYIHRSNGGCGVENGPETIRTKDNQYKRIKNIYADIDYIWQIGDCSEDSVKLFNAISSKVSVENLLNNKFILVNDDEKYQTYYANPGFVIQVDKDDQHCKKNKNCELNIFLKKKLNSAILDAQGKLHTDEAI